MFQLYLATRYTPSINCRTYISAKMFFNTINENFTKQELFTYTLLDCKYFPKLKCYSLTLSILFYSNQ